MELLLLSLCIFLCKRSLIFRVEVYPVWMARELGSHIFHLMYLLAFFLFALKKTPLNMSFNFSFKPVEITGYLLAMKALFSLKRKE